jgi:hypothetical protein
MHAYKGIGCGMLIGIIGWLAILELAVLLIKVGK